MAAVLFRRPAWAGAREALSVTVRFDDGAARSRVKRDFDGQETVSVSVPVTAAEGDAWQAMTLEYVGRAGPHDEHAAVIPVDLGGGRKLDVAALRQWGVAGQAKLRGPSGEDDVHFQGPGENAPVTDVGAVDGYGVGWASPVRGNGYVGGAYRAGDLQPGTTLELSKADLQRGTGWFQLALEVYAPGITDRQGTTPPARLRAIDDMDLVVESSYLQGGRQPLAFLGVAGPGGNNFQVGFQLVDYRGMPGTAGGQPTPPPGAYPVFVKKGPDVLAQLTLVWKG